MHLRFYINFYVYAIIGFSIANEMLIMIYLQPSVRYNVTHFYVIYGLGVIISTNIIYIILDILKPQSVYRTKM